MREALVRLEGEGWLSRLTDRLLSVKVVDLVEYLHALNVRRLLECEAVRVAAERLNDTEITRLNADLAALTSMPDPENESHWSFDDDLHFTIAAASGNPVLARMVDELRKSTHLGPAFVGGVFTPTEAASIAVPSGLVIAMLVYKESRIADLPEIILKASAISAAVMMIIATASVFSWPVASRNIPAQSARRFGIFPMVPGCFWPWSISC